MKQAVRSFVRMGAVALATTVASALGAQQQSPESAFREAASGASFDIYQHVAAGQEARDTLWFAENAPHGLRTSFSREGVVIAVHGDGGGEARLELALAAWGRPAALRDAGPARVEASGASIELHREALIEWYSNGVEGLEQGFTLLEAPSLGLERTGVELRLSIGGAFEADNNTSDGLVFRDACGEAVLSYSGLRAWDAAGRDLEAHMLATGEWLSILVDDSDALYPITVDPLVAALDAKLLPSDGLAHTLMGVNAAIDGDTAVALAAGPGSYGQVVLAYVFVRAGAGWVQQARLEGFGDVHSIGDVDIDGEFVVFSQDAQSDINGCWYVFERSGTIWSSAFTDCGGSCCTSLGLSVSLEGDRLAITDDLGGANNTKVYSRASGSWVEEHTFLPGGSVALRDDLLVMNAHNAPWSNPSIRVYQRSGSTWSLLATPMSQLPYGTYPVAIGEEHTIAVGDPFDDEAGTDAGAVYLLRRRGSSWVPWTKLLSPDFPSSLVFGSRISIEGGTLAVSSVVNDSAGTDAGAVYLFRRNGGWTQSLLLVAPDAAPNDRFGSDVSLSGDRLLVGAMYDDDQGTNRGSAYVFSIASEAEVYCTAKVNSLGCLPQIEFFGAPSITSASPFLVTVRQVLNNKVGVSYYGLNGRAAVPFQGGTRCVALPVKRTGSQVSAGNPGASDCSGFYSVDFNARIQSGIDPNLVLGAQVNQQFWSRDGGVASGTGLSDAIEFVIGA